MATQGEIKTIVRAIRGALGRKGGTAGGALKITHQEKGCNAQEQRSGATSATKKGSVKAPPTKWKVLGSLEKQTWKHADLWPQH